MPSCHVTGLFCDLEQGESLQLTSREFGIEHVGSMLFFHVFVVSSRKRETGICKGQLLHVDTGRKNTRSTMEPSRLDGLQIA
jgi:hypothetical protein